MSDTLVAPRVNETAPLSTLRQSPGKPQNVGNVERWASLIGGSALVIYGLSRRNLGGLTLALTGGGLLARGATGHCGVYSAVGVSTAEEKSPGIHVDHAVTIGKPVEELYAFWRDFENLPHFMNHLESVTVQSPMRSHWVAKAPMGKTVEWDAEITAEKTNELIAWCSVEGSDVENSGSVRFVPAPAGRGTEVRVSLDYNPPAGVLGATIAKLFGEEPSQQIVDDLRRFKRLMETGEIITTEGQPRG